MSKRSANSGSSTAGRTLAKHHWQRIAWLIPLLILVTMGNPQTGEAADICTNTIFEGDWHNAANWSCGKVPGNDDHVIVAPGKDLTISGPAEVGSLATPDWGYITFSGSGSLSVAGTFVNSDLLVRGPGTITVGGAFTQQIGPYPFALMDLFDGVHLILNGSSTLEAGDIATYEGSSLTINNTFVIGASATHEQALNGAGQLHIGPLGHLSREGTGATTIYNPTTNSGTVSVANGQTFQFVTSYTQDAGLTEIGAGGVLQGSPVINGGVLRGEGQVTGSVTNGSGTVEPGASAGTLTISGDYAQGPGGTLAIDVAGTIQGTGYDHLDVTGVATLGGTVAVTFGAGLAPSAADSFDFLTSASRIGTFGSLTGSIAPNGTVLALDYPGVTTVRLIASAPVLPDVVVELLTSQDLLDAILALPGSVVMVNVDGREFLIIPNMTSVGGDVMVTGNAALVAVDLGALQSAGGNIQVNGNLVMTTVHLAALEIVAGDLSVSGNPSLNALLVSGVTSIGGDLSITFNDSLTELDLGDVIEVDGDLVISDNADLGVVDLSSLTTVNGDLVISGNPDLTVINMSNLTTVSGEIIISGNPSLITVDLSSLTTASGELTLTGNTAATSVNIGNLETVGGDVDIGDNTAATTVNIGALETVGGNLDIGGNTAATTVNVAELTRVSGDLTLAGNSAATSVNIGNLETVGGNVDIGDNTAATTVNIGALETVGGNLDIGGNTAATTVNIGALTTVSGDLVITDNSAATTIDLSSLTTVSGDLTLADNSSATVIDISSLTTTTGDVTITDNGGATEVHIGSLATVGGNLIVDTNGDGTFTVGLVSPGGDTSIATDGYDAVSGTTAGGNTTIENAGAEAIMTAELLALSFVTPVQFTIARNDPATLAPEAGVGPDGQPATIDPVSAYTFTFGVPTLNRPATLSFDVLVDGLDPATRAALLAALATGSATMATQADDAGANYQAFPVCALGQAPEAEGCVLIELLDAAGQPALGVPAIVRFTNVVGHFSTWAVVIVTSTDEPDPEIPPTLTLPADLTVDATSAQGAVVHYAASATDAAGAAIAIACAPPSGSTFPMGATTVSCTATSSGGTSATGIFAVHVAGAAEQLADLEAKTLSYLSQFRLKLAMSVLLRTAANAETADRPQTACAALTVYSLTVWFAPSRELTLAEKVELTADARRIRDVIGCR